MFTLDDAGKTITLDPLFAELVSSGLLCPCQTGFIPIVLESDILGESLNYAEV